MLRIDQIKLSLEEDQSDLKKKVLKLLRIEDKELLQLDIHKKNIDARRKDIFFIYSVNVIVEKEERLLRRNIKNVRNVKEHKYKAVEHGIIQMSHRPIIVGFGPAGMFCALLLAKQGYKPIVFERGGDVDQRKQDVQTFIDTKHLNEESNIQFGEGGAGTFSDGKLTARSKDLRVQQVYESFVTYGAPEEILYEALPHLGSDKLVAIVKAMREDIIALGGEVHFNTKVTSLAVENDHIYGVYVDDKLVESNHVVLALGNSARDSVESFHSQGVLMESKPFAVGLRIEHKQVEINKALFHEHFDHPSLHQASYQLSHHTKDGGIYTFCMCPGGEVVAATSLKDRVVVNGMSYYKRDMENGNSAILVQVDQKDYGMGVFDGMKFQDDLERKAFVLGGSNYNAPIQRVKDFLNNKKTMDVSNVIPSYTLGVTYSDLNDLLPSRITSQLKEGILSFQKKNPAFLNGDAILTGVETRSSSPIRILRTDDLESLSMKGLYPIGEGSGYSGGIVSSSIDGLKCAEKIIELYAKCE